MQRHFRTCLPIATFAGRDICRSRHLPVATFADRDICRLKFCRSRHLPVATFAGRDICRSRHLPVATFAGRDICRSRHLPVATFADRDICRSELLITLSKIMLVQVNKKKLFPDLTFLPLTGAVIYSYPSRASIN